MATVHQIQAAVWAAVDAVAPKSGISVRGLPVAISSAIGWPPMKVLQTIPQNFKAQTPTAIIGVYDRKISRNVTRWIPFQVSEDILPSTLTTSVVGESMNSGQSAQIALGVSVSPGDSVSAVFTSYTGNPSTMAAQVAIGVAGASLTSLAALLAAQINADPILSLWASAIAVGPDVNITNLTAKVLKLQSYAGNGAVETVEVGRRDRQFQITCWMPTEEIRQAVTDPIDAMIATAESAFGFTMPDGTPLRVSYQNDYYLEDDTLEDVYRRDFLLCVEYPVTTTDNLYALLAPIVDFEPSFLTA